MWFRTLLILLLLYFVVRSLGRILRPQDPQRHVKGTPPSKGGQIDESRIQDATFKDIPDK